MPQVVYNPADYCFEWIAPTLGEPMGWYKWNRMEAHRFALRDRNKSVPVTALVPRVGCRWQSRGVAFPNRPERRLECTLLACWEEGYEEPWFLVTDLEPDQAGQPLGPVVANVRRQAPPAGTRAGRGPPAGRSPGSGRRPRHATRGPGPCGEAAGEGLRFGTLLGRGPGACSMGVSFADCLTAGSVPTCAG